MKANQSIPPRGAARESILEDVKQIVAEPLGIKREEIRAQHLLVEDLGCDSLTMVEITMEVEEHFDVSISDEQADRVRRVGDIVEGVVQLFSDEDARQDA